MCVCMVVGVAPCCKQTNAFTTLLLQSHPAYQTAAEAILTFEHCQWSAHWLQLFWASYCIISAFKSSQTYIFSHLCGTSKPERVYTYCGQLNLNYLYCTVAMLLCTYTCYVMYVLDSMHCVSNNEFEANGVWACCSVIRSPGRHESKPVRRLDNPLVYNTLKSCFRTTHLCTVTSICVHTCVHTLHTVNFLD